MLGGANTASDCFRLFAVWDCLYGGVGGLLETVRDCLELLGLCMGVLRSVLRTVRDCL